MAMAAASCAVLQHAAFAAGPAPRRQRCGARRLQVVAQASSSSSTTVSGVPEKIKPDWAGDDALSQVVNAAINFKPLFNLMKLGARQTMKDTAEKRGVQWTQTVQELKQSEVYQIKEEIEDKSVQYPSYYTVPFHGYDDGNLNWLAAFEVEPAGDVMALRVWKTEELTPLQAQTRLRKAIYTAIRTFQAKHGLAEPKDMIDIGCSVGVSTRWLAGEWPQANITGLDLSPYFLAVAELRERQMGGGGGQRQRIRYVHGDMLDTRLPDASFDLVAVQFVTHECPSWVIESLVKECRRLLRPGGVLAIADNNPRSKVIQNLPPVLFTLMKSTEPHSDEYYQHDIEADMRAAGLQHVNTVESDPRHRVVLGHL
ncbi:Methyltransferase type 11 [Chlorella sorokiniana]|uniref:Methyltransferase type 11 n=1 Tax=Chlorella sorokiniana TaxID=3076 RepID=A0A2P6TRE1_CHLSO|nr:Methyltransferase type 11 [Chlorella sorokiniana]|eukprot:PRW56637.1 Methyltransferase type 11 [Chlorella sorokiniana]